MTEVETIAVSISVDVPNLDDDIRFYTSAFGFTKSAAPVPGVAVLRAGNKNVCLPEKWTGTRASTHTEETRHYQRHLTLSPIAPSRSPFFENRPEFPRFNQVMRRNRQDRRIRGAQCRGNSLFSTDQQGDERK
jgi:hypothetical protein